LLVQLLIYSPFQIINVHEVYNWLREWNKTWWSIWYQNEWNNKPSCICVLSILPLILELFLCKWITTFYSTLSVNYKLHGHLLFEMVNKWAIERAISFYLTPSYQFVLEMRLWEYLLCTISLKTIVRRKINMQQISVAYTGRNILLLLYNITTSMVQS
jgi:hypothetical protein